MSDSVKTVAWRWFAYGELKVAITGVDDPPEEWKAEPLVLRSDYEAAHNRAERLEAALPDLIEMAQEWSDHFSAAFEGYKPERHKFYADTLASARSLLGDAKAA